MVQCNRLFEPIKIGKIQLKNRIVMLALTTGYAVDDRITDRIKKFFAERAKGGVGLIVLGGLVPTYLSIANTRRLGVYDDQLIPELHEFTDIIHNYGAKVAAQVSLLFEWAKGKGAPVELVAPSAIATHPGTPPPRPLTVTEIHQIVEEHSEGIRRSREAGFDAVELHLGVGSFLNRFLSPLTNKRTDQYGGSLENRMRIILEILDNARKKVGQDYTFICRMSADEFMDGGHTLEDSRTVARMLETVGVDCLDVQAGWHESSIPLVQMCVPRGAFVYLAEGIKKVVDIPVIAAYRINDPILAEHILEEGKADLVGMCRALIADPDLPNKAKNGQYDDIRQCIACCRCLAGSLVTGGKPVECSINARAGREAEYSIEAANKRKNVLIVGGGPAGMEAARIAAIRGHQVRLWEKNDRLGGQLLLASISPDKGEINTLKDYLVRQMDKNGVQVRVGVNVTADAIAEEQPDVVVVATGAVPRVLDIPGAEGNNVATALDVLTGRKRVIGKAIIVGGGMVGCETALFLAKQNKEVTILEMLERVGYDLERVNRWVVMNQLRQAGINMETRAKVVEITDKGVRSIRNEVSELFQGDTVVLAVGMRPNNNLAKELRGKVMALHVIGDCTEPRRIAEAIEEGFRVAREI